MKREVRFWSFRDQLKSFPPRIVATLTLPLFIALKLAHVTDWSWWWVFSPLWIPALLALVIVALGAAAFTLVRWFLMARAWLRLRQSMLPEFTLADPAILSRIQAEHSPRRTPENTAAPREDGGRDA
jgi:Transmembrane Fragile-X-F protein